MQPASHSNLRTVQPKCMEEEIDVSQFHLSLLLICHPALVHARHNVQYLFTEAGDEDRLLVRGCMQCKCGEELPDWLVEDVRRRKGSRYREGLGGKTSRGK